MGKVLRAVIFDFNGVIIDDEPIHLELFRRVLEEEGVPLNEEDYHKRYLGLDDRGCFVAALIDTDREKLANDVGYINRLISRKAVLYQNTIQERQLLFPGVVEQVRTLASRLPLAIVSGALRNEIEWVLTRNSIRDCFTVIVAAEDVSACKPDPQGFVKALAEFNSLESMTQIIQSDECLVIEDSIAGVAAAKRAGMLCLAVTNSYRAEELREADWVVPSLIDCDLVALVKAL